jgi:hypothetical protein
LVPVIVTVAPAIPEDTLRLPIAGAEPLLFEFEFEFEFEDPPPPPPQPESAVNRESRTSTAMRCAPPKNSRDRNRGLGPDAAIGILLRTSPADCA